MNGEAGDLIDRSLSGDQSAMRTLIERYKGRVYALCYRMLGQRQDAEDMTQETFVRALKSLHQWDRQRDFEPWLLAIAGNRCRTLLARRQRHPRATQLIEEMFEEKVTSHAAQQHLAEIAEEVEVALGHLRDEHRQALLLFHEQGLSYMQIGEILDCPLGTVKTWVHRARREMIARLSRRGVVPETPHAVRKV